MANGRMGNGNGRMGDTCPFDSGLLVRGDVCILSQLTSHANHNLLVILARQCCSWQNSVIAVGACWVFFFLLYQCPQIQKSARNYIIAISNVRTREYDLYISVNILAEKKR